MRRRVTGKVDYEKYIEEKFSLVYMEIQKQGDRQAGEPAFIVPKRSTRWHLEDEQRPSLALCGFPLSGVCKSVSPALAMLGTPCKECVRIVKDWISNAGSSYEEVRVRALIMTDIPFRAQVKEVCDDIMFVLNSPRDTEHEVEDPLGLNRRREPKTKSPLKKKKK